MAKLLLLDLALLSSDLRGLGLEPLALLVLDPKGFFTSLVLAKLLEPHELDFLDVLLADLLDLFGVVSPELRELGLRLPGVPRRVPAADEGARLGVAVGVVVAVVVGGSGGGGEGAEEGAVEWG